MNVKKILEETTINSASDIWIVAGRPLSYKSNGTLQTLNEIILYSKDTYEFVTALYALARRDISYFDRCGDDRFSFTLPRFSRYRVSAFKQRGSYAAVIRVIPLELPDAASLGIPETVSNLARLSNGLVLVAGSGGSGKSTTIASILDRINQETSGHIITLEEPLEFLHPHKSCMISQRELPADSESYPAAIENAFFQSADVLMIAEMPDAETVQAALAAAENRHLVFTTMRTESAAETLDSLIHRIPVSEQQHFSMRLAAALRAVICQKLLPSADGRLVPAFEILTMNPALRRLISSTPIDQISEMTAAFAKEGLLSMDESIFRLFSQGSIDAETAIAEAVDPAGMKKRIYPKPPVLEGSD